MPLRHEGKKSGSSPLKGEIGDDIPVEACLNHGKCQPPISFPPASYVIPTEARGGEGIYRRRFKSKNLIGRPHQA